MPGNQLFILKTGKYRERITHLSSLSWIQDKQIIDEEWFLCREIVQLGKREGGTKSTYKHCATASELMDPGNGY